MEVSDQRNSLHSGLNLGYTDSSRARELEWTKNYNFIFTNLT